MARNPGIKFETFILNAMQEYYPEASRRKGSGSVHGLGDVCAGPFEIECKDNPSQKSISITEKDWKHTAAAARSEGKIPLFCNKNTNGVFLTMPWVSFLVLLQNSINGELLKAENQKLEEENIQLKERIERLKEKS